MVMKAHKKTSGVWLIVETVLVFVLGWFLADPEIMKLYRSMFIPMGWDYENVVVVPVEVLPDYDPDYRPEAMERERMTEDFRRMGEVLSSVSGVEYAAPCRISPALTITCTAGFSGTRPISWSAACCTGLPDPISWKCSVTNGCCLKAVPS